MSSFDNIRHDRLLEKVAQRVDDADIMHLLKIMLKASGKKGVPQGGVVSPLLSNLYLNEVDKMLERAREVTRNGKCTYVEYARFADDCAPRRREEEEPTRCSLAAQEMRVGPSDPDCRIRVQTTASCSGTTAGVVSVAEKAE